MGSAGEGTTAPALPPLRSVMVKSQISSSQEKAEPAGSSTCLCLAFHTDPEHLPVFVGDQMKTTRQRQCRVYILTVIVTISGVLVT